MNQHDPSDIAGHEKSQRERQKRQRSDAYMEDDDMKWLMGSRQGRRIMHRVLDRAGIFRTSFTGNSETFFREGERNVGLILFNQIMVACPESFTQMMKDQKERRSSTDNRNAGTN